MSIYCFSVNYPDQIKIMKIAIILSLYLSLLSGCKPTSDLTIISADKVVEAHKTANYEFAKNKFEACEAGNYTPLTRAIATPELVASLTVDLMRQTCLEINKTHGELVKLTLHEVLRRGQSQLIYRYKANYSNAPQQAEIRIYADLDNKYSGIIFRKIWSNKYYVANVDQK